MDYYCKCKYCQYTDPSERSGCKWWCEWYRQYFDPEKLQECKHYKSR